MAFNYLKKVEQEITINDRLMNYKEPSSSPKNRDEVVHSEYLKTFYSS